MKKQSQWIGPGYNEGFSWNNVEMIQVFNRASPDGSLIANGGLLCIRGLPFGCNKETIRHFFSGLETVPSGIILPVDFQGKSTGTALVQFASQEAAEIAIRKHKGRPEPRYLENLKNGSVPMPTHWGPFRAFVVKQRLGPYDRQGPELRLKTVSGEGSDKGMRPRVFERLNGSYICKNRSNDDPSIDFNISTRRIPNNRFGDFIFHNATCHHWVHMRGLPYKATVNDIYHFFSPLCPLRVHIEIGEDGKATGEADVDFVTHEDAVAAMVKEKTYMQHRYIELFLYSTAKGRMDAFTSKVLKARENQLRGNPFERQQPNMRCNIRSGLKNSLGGGSMSQEMMNGHCFSKGNIVCMRVKDISNMC
ncbi:heterogeneous nuclear ribonucleoprotein H-like [Monodelphis domestica]|uniref:Heterogeneous nuclear ribonucleoprotein H-like n=1 Tax=Monodelphis domestica TaxID=13616 RepID=A0A5F8H759_MONDO|nr:heterogeneous nuclear ribonucleoprotein H-like [Monodelphis domestica]